MVPRRGTGCVGEQLLAVAGGVAGLGGDWAIATPGKAINTPAI